MTTQEKIDLLEKMLQVLQDESKWSMMKPCLCGAYHWITSNSPTELELNELGLFRPKKNYKFHPFWWEQRDTQSRIQACKDAIAKHKKQLRHDNSKTYRFFYSIYTFFVNKFRTNN